MTKEGNNCPDCKGNPHIIVGPNRRCLCGVYGIASTLGERAISCAELLSKLESLVQTRNTDAFELWEAISPLVEDCSQPTPPTPAGAGTETPTATQARDSALKFIDHFFRNGKRPRPVIRIPVQADDDDRIVMRYIDGTEAELTSLRRQAEADRAMLAALNIQNTEWAYKITALRAQLATADKDRERKQAALEMASGRMAYMAGAFGNRFSDEDKNINRVVFKEIRSALQPSTSLDHGATGEKTL